MQDEDRVAEEQQDSHVFSDIEAIATEDETIVSFRREASTPRSGSKLHRNSQRARRLKGLFMKRQLRQKIVVEAGDESEDFVTKTLRDEDITDDVKDLLQEVKEEAEGGELSAKLKELHSLVDPYTINGTGFITGQYPLEVRLENVTYAVDSLEDGETQQKIQTVYNSSFVYSAYKWLRRVSKCQPAQRIEKPRKHILQNINLVIQPGKQYLILGPPGCGKTSLLKTIAGLYRNEEENRTMDGSITYNGTALVESDGLHIENAFGYIDQLDKHAPLLTVGETLEFAFQCKTGGKIVRERTGLSEEQLDLIEKAQKDGLSRKLMLCILGLNEVEDTFVGDENLRGVSGGQRRRVTVGEMLMSRTPVICGDEISTGLDSATTYDMVETLLHIGRGSNFSRVFALLQPSPEVVSLFDEVIVLAEGRVIYAGPVEEVEDYFAAIGFKSPEFVDVADFLQMVATEDRDDLYDPQNNNSTPADPPSISRLADIFKESDQGKRIQKKLESPNKYVFKKDKEKGSYVTSEHGENTNNMLQLEAVKKKYANQWYRSTLLISRRFLTLWVRDRKVLAFSILRNVVNGASVGGVFFNADDFVSIQGAIFQTGIFVLLGSLQSSSGLVPDRILFYKHADANFYSAWPYVFGRTVSQIPQTLLLDTIVSGSILYFLIGLGGRDSATNFISYLGILFMFAMVMNQQMAVFASFASESKLQVYGAVTLFFSILFGGYIIPLDTIPTYFYWAYWINPFAWAYNAMIVNEVYSGRYENPERLLIENGLVGPDGSPFSKDWIGWSLIFMGVFFLFCWILTALGLAYTRNSGEMVAPEKAELPMEKDVDGEQDASTTTRIDIPFKPVTLSVKDLCYEVTASTSNNKLMLLKNVNGIFHPGRLCALMGSTGAGKTTLMDVIALRKRSGTITGEISLNGWPQDRISFRRCSGYVEQFDVQSPELTVRETAIFSARLRLDPLIVEKDEDILAFVDRILKDVELSELADSLVGSDEGVGLSFEQKKRLSIAVELAASPSVLFLDEPTSGLDARSALLVVRLLRKIADSGRTIVATIHQPSSAVFDMFDDLLLLKKGGQVVYHGPLGSNSENLISYFESKGAPAIELGDNPANWTLRVLKDDITGDPAEIYKASHDFSLLQGELSKISNSPNPEMKIDFDSEFATSKSTRQRLTNRRLRTIYWRSPTYNLGRLMIFLIMACLLGSVFISNARTLEYTESDIRARISVIFFSNIILGIMSIISVLPVMTWIRDMFYRHRDAGMYDSLSLGVALGTAESWFICISSILFCIVFLITSGVGFGVKRLIGFWGFFTFNSALFSYFGQLFVSAVKSPKAAMTLCGIYIGFNNLFSGLVILPQKMNTGFYAITWYITPGHYIFEGEIASIMFNDFRQVRATGGSDFNDWLIENGKCTISQEEACIGDQKDYVLYFFGGEYTADHISRNLIILGVVLALVRYCTWIALKHIRFSK